MNMITNTKMNKKSIFAIIIIGVGVVFGFLSMVSFVQIQATIEYFKTLPPGSSQPGIDYSQFYNFMIVSGILLASGFAIYLKFN